MGISLIIFLVIILVVIPELAILPIWGFYQGLVGAIWPSDDPEIRRQQRVTLVLVLIGTITFVSGLAWLHWSDNWSIIPFVVAFACLALGGFLGKQLERRCREEDEAKKNNPAQPTDAT